VAHSAPERAKNEVWGLVEGYARCADGRDVDGFRALFADDAVLTVIEPDGTPRPPLVGVDQIAKIPVRLGRYDRTVHRVGTPEVDADGPDAATGTVECEAHHHLGATDTVMTITYEDRYRRAEDGWRFAERTVRIRHQEDHRIEGDET
jgi:ketosteroid isomerase-like protein